MLHVRFLLAVGLLAASAAPHGLAQGRSLRPVKFGTAVELRGTQRPETTYRVRFVHRMNQTYLCVGIPIAQATVPAPTEDTLYRPLSGLVAPGGPAGVWLLELATDTLEGTQWEDRHKLVFYHQGYQYLGYMLRLGNARRLVEAGPLVRLHFDACRRYRCHYTTETHSTEVGASGERLVTTSDPYPHWLEEDVYLNDETLTLTPADYATLLADLKRFEGM